MKTMPIAVVLLLLGSSVYAQYPDCLQYPNVVACQPIPVQVVPPKAGHNGFGADPNLGTKIFEMLSSADEAREKRQRAAREDAREERRLRLEEAREERLAREGATQTPHGATPPAAPPTPLAPEVQAQLLAFAKTHPDWEQHAPKMLEYGAKLRPGETDAAEYLTLLYRLAKMDAK